MTANYNQRTPLGNIHGMAMLFQQLRKLLTVCKSDQRLARQLEVEYDYYTLKCSVKFIFSRYGIRSRDISDAVRDLMEAIRIDG